MASPAWIIPAYSEVLHGVDDVQAIIDRLRIILLAIGWTESPANTFRTPNDPAGRWFQLALSRASQTRLKMLLTDDQARSASENGSMDIAGTVSIQFYYSTRYLYINRLGTTAANGEYLLASLLSLAPEGETAHNKYCVCKSSRDNAGGVYGVGPLGIDAINAAGIYQVIIANALSIPYVRVLTTTKLAITRHPSGGRRWSPAWHQAPDAAGNRIRGRLYNAIILAAEEASAGQEFSVPIDQSTVATFKVLIMPVASDVVMAVRKS